MADNERSERTTSTRLYAIMAIMASNRTNATLSTTSTQKSVTGPMETDEPSVFEDMLDESSSSGSDETKSSNVEIGEKYECAAQGRGDIYIDGPGPSCATGADKNVQAIRSEDDPDEIIMSLVWMKNYLGAAYYNVHNSQLFVMDDAMDDHPNHTTVKALYRQCQPQWLVMTTGTPDTFLNVVKKLIIADTMDDNDRTSLSSMGSSTSRVSLKFMPKKENSYENCCHRVLCLKLNNEPEDTDNAGRKTFLNSVLNFKCRLMIHALGLLLNYIDANWNKLTLDAGGHAEFVHLNYITLNDLVMIDNETYKTLGIVQSRFHPSLFKFGNLVSKDKGISLFTLLNRCHSRPGVLYLWKLMRHPTKDKLILNKRFQAIKFFLDPNNQNVAESLRSCLGQIYRLNANILNRYSAPQAKPSDWSKLYKTLCQVINIGDICANYQNDLTVFEEIVESITAEVHTMRYFIDHIVDFEMSKVHEKLVVNAGVDAALDNLNETRKKLPDILTRAAEKDMENYNDMERCRMLYLPDIGYVLAITGWKGSPEQELKVPQLEFKFTINGVRHYKSNGAKELDETVGDVLLEITKLQSQIILKVVRYISTHVGQLLKAIEHCAELDTLLAFAMVARDYNYVEPKVVESKIIDIKRGRHPLKELVGTFVPNDTLSKEGGSLMKIITGPNACGKSIYLKQVALIVFMTHIGTFVPAESATIGIVSNILAQINSNDSLAENASSFLLGLRQTNAALFASTPNSLVIIDEFGAGTSEVDGLALLTSVLRTFFEREQDCPHVFVATHIHRVIKLLPETPAIEAQTFEYVSAKDHDLVFLHRLIPGSTSLSFAHSVARNAGLGNDIVQRAVKVFDHMQRGSLPTPLPDKTRETTNKHITELVSMSSSRINHDQLTEWVKQTAATINLKK